MWERLFEKVKDRDQALGMVFLDGTTIRAHHKAAGAAKKGGTENAERIVRLLAAHVEDLAPRSV
ncbi:transposase [Komagataeibacter sucrofermentans DSM 15973]|nr:transposase [Komagataeibacter sucrofermentans DSM 15973]